MLDIPSISGIIAAVGVIVGVVFTVLELRNLAQQRQTDMVMRLYSSFGSKEFQDAWARIEASEFRNYNEYAKKYGVGDYVECATFFDGIGVLLQKKLIDINLVDSLFSVPVKLTYEGMKPLIESNREQFHDPRVFENFEYLYNEMIKEWQQQGSTTA